jgi:hypothetical protein
LASTISLWKSFFGVVPTCTSLKGVLHDLVEHVHGLLREDLHILLEHVLREQPDVLVVEVREAGLALVDLLLGSALVLVEQSRPWIP